MPRKPKPIEQHIAEGTLNATRHAKAPTVVAGRGKVEMATPEGVELAGLLERILDAADAPMIEAAAMMLARARAAGADVATNGMFIETEKVGRSGESFVTRDVNPAIRIERDSWTQFRLMAGELGIGPSARARLAGLGEQGAPASDDFDELREHRERKAS